jgi:hypothetical protein
MSSQYVARDSCSPRSSETVQHNIAWIREYFYQIPDKALRFFRRVHRYFFSLLSNGIAHNVFHYFLAKEVKYPRFKKFSLVVHQP